MKHDDSAKLRMLLTGMRDAYSRGENAMQYARNHLAPAGSANLPLATFKLARTSKMPVRTHSTAPSGATGLQR